MQIGPRLNWQFALVAWLAGWLAVRVKWTTSSEQQPEKPQCLSGGGGGGERPLLQGLLTETHTERQTELKRHSFDEGSFCTRIQIFSLFDYSKLAQ